MRASLLVPFSILACVPTHFPSARANETGEDHCRIVLAVIHDPGPVGVSVRRMKERCATGTAIVVASVQESLSARRSGFIPDGVACDTRGVRVVRDLRPTGAEQTALDITFEPLGGDAYRFEAAPIGMDEAGRYTGTLCGSVKGTVIPVVGGWKVSATAQ